MRVLLIAGVVFIFYGVVVLLTNDVDWRIKARWFSPLGVDAEKPADWDSKRKTFSLVVILIGVVCLLLNFLVR